MKVIFCIPGNSFSNRFLKSWTKLQQELNKKNIEYELMCEYTPNIYQVRGLLLGANIQYGPTQQPWQGKKDYDYIMWIDSDQVIYFANGTMKLIVPFASYVYLEDTEIDFSEDLLNGGFKFGNPQANRTCGCGTSFSV